MLWHHNARVNSHQRWKQTRFRVCFHLWCELTITMNATEWQVSWNSRLRLLVGILGTEVRKSHHNLISALGPHTSLVHWSSILQSPFANKMILQMFSLIGNTATHTRLWINGWVRLQVLYWYTWYGFNWSVGASYTYYSNTYSILMSCHEVMCPFN